MNRSQRRAAAIGKSIVAGLLCAGCGLSAAALAAADGHDGTGRSAASNNGGGRGGAAVSDSADEAVGTPTRRGVRFRPSTGENDWHPDWCHIIWPAWPIDPLLPYTGNRNGIIAQLLPVPARAVIVSGIVDAGEHASTASAGEPPPAAPPAEPPAAPPSAPSAPSGAQAQAPVAFPAAAPAPPVAQPAAVPAPESVAPAPDRLPVRLPQLPPTDLGQIAAVALPGLVGIAALTALGGFLGYRQAKAGYVLRATGTARFLQ